MHRRFATDILLSLIIKEVKSGESQERPGEGQVDIVDQESGEEKGTSQVNKVGRAAGETENQPLMREQAARRKGSWERQKGKDSNPTAIVSFFENQASSTQARTLAQAGRSRHGCFSVCQRTELFSVSCGTCRVA